MISMGWTAPWSISICSEIAVSTPLSMTARAIDWASS